MCDLFDPSEVWGYRVLSLYDLADNDAGAVAA